MILDPERAPLVRRAFQEFATGRFIKQEVRANITALGLKTRRGQPVPSQTFDALLRNQVYIGRVDVPGYGISTRGDFEPLTASWSKGRSDYSEVRMVDQTGIEPVTSSMPLMRAPNCATGPLVGKRNL